MADRKKLKKWGTQSTVMYMVGYDLDGQVSSYQLYNPKSRRVMESWDIVWEPWNDKVFDPRKRQPTNLEVSNNKADAKEGDADML